MMAGQDGWTGPSMTLKISKSQPDVRYFLSL